jgi:trimeric autotransporter adhesin
VRPINVLMNTSRMGADGRCPALLVLWAAVSLAAFSIGCDLPPHASEDASECGRSESNDGRGEVECSDPACADALVCQQRCGDGRRDSGELCDDGNIINGDGCEVDCTLPACGNGIIDAGEACDDGNAVSGDGCEADCKLPSCGNGIADPGEVCDDGNATNDDGCDTCCVASTSVYVKASNTAANDQLGSAVALSADGTILAVGAPLEDGASRGVNGNQEDRTAPYAGAVYVYARRGLTWHQEAYVKASNTARYAQFGTSVALSADGSILAVGATGEASAARGIDGDEANGSAPGAGAVYLFVRSGATWRQYAYIKASNPDADDQFGTSVALTADGSMVAVGAIGEASADRGVAGNEADNSMAGSGAVYVFTRTLITWQQQAYIKASNPGLSDAFGWSVALSSNGATLAVSALLEDSAATGIDGNQADNSSIAAGAVYVFAGAGAAWSQQAYVKASNADRADNFGSRIALSADGARLAVGAVGEDSAATGLGGDQTSNATLEAGAAYVFTRSGSAWTQEAYVKASNTGLSDQFGWSIAISSDGDTMVVGAATEDSAATGVNGDQTDNWAPASGAVYRFKRVAGRWDQDAYLKPSNTSAGDQFGSSVSLAGDGTIASGAPGEPSAAKGIASDQGDRSASGAGAVYLLH